MRIAIPTRLNPRYVAIFIAAVFVGQEIESTNLLFALLTAAYTALWAASYNLSGGIEYPSGAFIFSNGLLSVVLGFSSKVLLGETGERNMLAPLTTLSVYVVGMLMTLIVVFITRSLRPARGLLKDFDSLAQLKQASIACLFIGVGLTAILSRAISAEGTILSALGQLNSFSLFSILLATTYEVKASNGKRSVNWIVVTAIGIDFVNSLIYFTKGGMLIGFVAWAIAASLQGYNFRRYQILGLAVGLTFFTYYLVPYSQYVRVYGSKTGSALENIPTALRYLSDLEGTRRLYNEAIEDFEIKDEPHLYDKREGFLDRLIQVAPDDALIDYTNHGHVFGLLPTYAAFVSDVPHFLWPNKPTFNAGNVYAHELGELAEEDETTGITFSPAADAFHQEAWLGILLLLPAALFIQFIVIDTVAGSARYSAFALIPVVKLMEGGAGGGVGGCIHFAVFEVVELLLMVWTTKVAVPWVLRTIKPGRFAPAPVADVAPPQLTTHV